MRTRFPPTWPTVRRMPPTEVIQRPPTDEAFQAIAGEEENALRSSTPPRSFWPDLDRYQEHITRIDQRGLELQARHQGLQEEIRRAEEADREALADVALDPEKPRPEPTVPKLEAELEAVRREQDALRLARTKVLAEKARWVERHRKKLVKEADAEAARHEQRIHALADEFEQERNALVAARQTTIWAACFGTPAASEAVPTAILMCGLAGPTKQALNTDVQLAAERIVQAVHLDAKVLRGVGSPEQLKALGKKYANDREAYWERQTDLVGPPAPAAWGGSEEEKLLAERDRRYSEQLRRRLRGEQ
jgi:hypothetical protein